MAYTAVPDQGSALYAELCNLAALIYYAQNDLKRCQEYNEKCLKIREAILAPNDPDLVNSYHNLSSLATARGRYDEALEILAKTEKIRIDGREEALISLGLTHMGIGHVYFFRQQYFAASERYHMAEETLKLGLGPSSPLMAQWVIFPHSPAVSSFKLCCLVLEWQDHRVKLKSDKSRAA